jgi:hypothetical protein
VSIVEAPHAVSAGRPVRYLVQLTNPTDRAVSLTGPVGFSQFLISSGGSGVAPFQITNLFRLNRRAVQAIPAHGSVRYRMSIVAPAQLTPGLTLTVNWLLLAPGLPDAPTHRAAFDAQVAS